MNTNMLLISVFITLAVIVFLGFGTSMILAQNMTDTGTMTSGAGNMTTDMNQTGSQPLLSCIANPEGQFCPQPP